MNYNEALQKVIMELGLNQSELAISLELSRQQLSNIVNGKSLLTQKSLRILHNKYNINLNFIISGEGSMFATDLQLKDNVKIVKLKKGQLLKVEYEE